MTFKDLKKRASLETTGQYRLLERLRNKLFWIWNVEEHKKEDVKTSGSALEYAMNHIQTKSKVKS